MLLGDGGWWLAVVRCAGPGGAAGHIKAAGNVMAGKHRIIIGRRFIKSFHSESQKPTIPDYN